ncbi:MAG: cupin domain-containing protein [Rhodobacteraceae bacterium]|jgi:uncharacterized cupin superfamily protein|nr:cupin domain-containing protein [Paracoccaceae bacterium]
MPVIRADDARTEPAPGAPDPVTGPYRARLFSDTGGLTQFGAFEETLMPGSRSSLCHWHAEEDEMVYVLSGEVTVHEAGTVTTLHPGDAVCWKAGVALGHDLENRTDGPVTYLVVGTRAPRDRVTYPDNDRVQTIDRTAGTRVWTTRAGDPADDAYRR